MSIVSTLSGPSTIISTTLNRLAPQLLAELDSAYDAADALENLLVRASKQRCLPCIQCSLTQARECDNGRMLRVLIKLGFINERPAHEGL
jgi:hypothetical protein